MKSFYSGWVNNAGLTDKIKETIDLETETGCVYLIHDDSEITKKEFEILMLIEEKYPELLHSDSPLFLPPEDDSDLSPEILDILHGDTETLINDIISCYRKGSNINQIVPKKLINANSYNREIMDILKRISG